MLPSGERPSRCARIRHLLHLLPLYATTALVVPVPPSCSTSQSCRAALLSAFAACAAAHAPCTIALSAGVYDLSAPRGTPYWLAVVGARDVAVVGAGPGSTILMVADVSNTIALGSCTNITFAELALDMPRPPFTLGHVRASSAGVSTLDFDGAEFPINTTAYPWLASCQAVIGYDIPAGRMSRGGVDDYFLTNSPAISYSGVAPALTMSIPISLPVGADVIVRHVVYGNNAFTVADSDAFALRNVTLYAAGGMGLLASNVSGIALDGFKVLKAPGRVMSITADGFHSGNTRGGAVTVRHCVFEGQGDDGINIPTLYIDIQGVSVDRRVLTVGQANAGTLRAGATVNFFNRSSLLPLGVGVVAALQLPTTVTLVDPLPAAVRLYDLLNNVAGYAGFVEVSRCACNCDIRADYAAYTEMGGGSRPITFPLQSVPHIPSRSLPPTLPPSCPHSLTRSLTACSKSTGRAAPC